VIDQPAGDRKGDTVAQPCQDRGTDDSGAVAVEAALIIPVLVVLLFGIIEFSWLLKDHVAATSLVRAGVRTASSEPRNASFLNDTQTTMEIAGSALPKNAYEELWIYKAQTSGANAGHPTGDSDWSTCGVKCVRYAWDTHGNWVPTGGGGWDVTTINACPGSTDSVGVYLKARHTWLTHMFADTSDVADHAVMKFEPIATYGGATVCGPVP
jgi:Flp pilus assembly protein TadG